jgi:hypothetical protein
LRTRIIFKGSEPGGARILGVDIGCGYNRSN